MTKLLFISYLLFFYDELFFLLKLTFTPQSHSFIHSKNLLRAYRYHTQPQGGLTREINMKTIIKQWRIAKLQMGSKRSNDKLKLGGKGKTNREGRLTEEFTQKVKGNLRLSLKDEYELLSKQGKEPIQAEVSEYGTHITEG